MRAEGLTRWRSFLRTVGQSTPGSCQRAGLNEFFFSVDHLLRRQECVQICQATVAKNECLAVLSGFLGPSQKGNPKRASFGFRFKQHKRLFPKRLCDSSEHHLRSQMGQDRHWTYQQLCSAACSLRDCLVDAGLRPEKGRASFKLQCLGPSYRYLRFATVMNNQKFSS